MVNGDLIFKVSKELVGQSVGHTVQHGFWGRTFERDKQVLLTNLGFIISVYKTRRPLHPNAELFILAQIFSAVERREREKVL